MQYQVLPRGHQWISPHNLQVSIGHPLEALGRYIMIHHPNTHAIRFPKLGMTDKSPGNLVASKVSSCHVSFEEFLNYPHDEIVQSDFTTSVPERALLP